MSGKTLFKYWLPVVLWMAVIYLVSTAAFSADHTSRLIRPILHFLLPQASEETLQFLHGIIRKLAHFTEYFILGVLLFRAFRAGSPVQQDWRWAILSLLAGVLYAAGDELHQSFVSTRTPALFDVAIDSLGGLVAQCAILIKRRRSSPNATTN
jgi:VanZ family protein